MKSNNFYRLVCKHYSDNNFCIKTFLDDINVQTEEIVYEAFLSWLNYDLKRQNNHLAELFSLIRLPLIERKV